jgi:hypothetical protein
MRHKENKESVSTHRKKGNEQTFSPRKHRQQTRQTKTLSSYDVFKKNVSARCRWPTPVAVWEAEIRRILVRGQLKQRV